MSVAIKLKPETKEIVDTAIKQILSAGNPLKIFLFGSYARGEENGDSDIDFYIVEDLPNRKTSIAAKYYKALFQLNHAKDIIVRSSTEFEKNKVILNTLEHDVYNEGLLLYERK